MSLPREELKEADENEESNGNDDTEGSATTIEQETNDAKDNTREENADDMTNDANKESHPVTYEYDENDPDLQALDDKPEEEQKADDPDYVLVTAALQNVRQSLNVLEHALKRFKHSR